MTWQVSFGVDSAHRYHPWPREKPETIRKRAYLAGTGRRKLAKQSEFLYSRTRNECHKGLFSVWCLPWGKMNPFREKMLLMFEPSNPRTLMFLLCSVYRSRHGTTDYPCCKALRTLQASTVVKKRPRRSTIFAASTWLYRFYRPIPRHCLGRDLSALNPSQDEDRRSKTYIGSHKDFGILPAYATQGRARKSRR